MQPIQRRRSSSSASKDASVIKALADRELDDAYANEAYLFGWSLPALFCAASLIGYHIPCYFIVRYVESHTDALVIDGQGLPWRTFYTTMAAFGTSLMLDAVTWLWTVDKRIARLFMFPTVIKWNSFVSYWLMSNGMVPILLDFKGRRLVPTRYLQWFFTTPAMLYLYSILSFTRREELIAAIILDELMLISGFLACYLDPPSNLIWLCASFGCFYFVICAINNMLLAAVERCSPDDEGHRRALTWARLFMTVTWSFIPLVWCLSAIDMISVTLEEQLLELFDVLSKAAASSMLLHCSMQTQSAKILVKQSAIIEEERQNVVNAVQETAVHKERFLAAISHELRTPLNGIIGLAENVIVGNCGAIADKVREHLNTIKQSGQRLHSLVNDILDANSLKNKSMQVTEQPIDIGKVCTDVAETLLKQGTKAGVELRANMEGAIPEVLADAVNVKKMLLHVLGNAIKFTEEGSVTLTVKLDRDHRRLVYVVADTGPGIPDEQRDRVWGAFNQGDEGLGRKHGGTGLGLTLARQLVTAQNGEISFESVVGQGTTFTIWTPAKLSDESKLEQMGAEPLQVRSLLPVRRPSEGSAVRALSSAPDQPPPSSGPASVNRSASLETSPKMLNTSPKTLTNAEADSVAAAPPTPMGRMARRALSVQASVPPMGEEDLPQKSPGSMAGSCEGSGGRAQGALLSPTGSYNQQGSAASLAPDAYAHVAAGAVLSVHADGWGGAPTAAGPLQLGMAVERLAGKVEALAASFGVLPARSLASGMLVVAPNADGPDPESQLFVLAKELVQALEADEMLAEEGLRLRLGLHSGKMSVRTDLSRRVGQGPLVFGEAADLAALLAATAPAHSVHVSQPTRDRLSKDADWSPHGEVAGRPAGPPTRTFVAWLGQTAAAGKGGEGGLRFRQCDAEESVPPARKLPAPISQPLPSASEGRGQGEGGGAGPSWSAPSVEGGPASAAHRRKGGQEGQPGGDGPAREKLPRKEEGGEGKAEGRVEGGGGTLWMKREEELMAQLQTLEVLLAAERLDASIRQQESRAGTTTSTVVAPAGDESGVTELLGALSELQVYLLLLLKGKEELAEYGGALCSEVEVVLAVLGLERHGHALALEEVTSMEVLLQMGEGALEEVGVKSHMSRSRIVSAARSLSAVAKLFRSAASDLAPPPPAPPPNGRPPSLLTLQPPAASTGYGGHAAGSPASYGREAAQRPAPPMPRWEDYAGTSAPREDPPVMATQRALKGRVEGRDRSGGGAGDDRQESTRVI